MKSTYHSKKHHFGPVAGIVLALWASCNGGDASQPADAGDTPTDAGDAIDPIDPNDTSLAALSTSALATLQPAFDPSVAEYYLDVSYVMQEIRLTAIPRNPAASMTVNGVPLAADRASAPIPLPPGDTRLEVQVSVPSGINQTYVIHVDRGAPVKVYAELTASNADPEDRFGTSKAAWGDIIVVGAPGEDSDGTGIDGGLSDNSLPDSGAVYVFRRRGSAWEQEAYLKIPSPETAIGCGIHVSVWENTLTIMCVTESFVSGRLYVFEHDGAEWKYTQELSVPLQHTVMWRDFVAFGSRDGIHVYRRKQTGWDEALIAHPCAASYLTSLAIADYRLAVGCALDSSAAPGVHPYPDWPSDSAAYASGAVFLYDYVDGAWTPTFKIKSPRVATNESFGSRISIRGDVLLAVKRLTSTRPSLEMYRFANTTWEYTEHNLRTSLTSYPEKLHMEGELLTYALPAAGTAHAHRFHATQWEPLATSPGFPGFIGTLSISRELLLGDATNPASTPGGAVTIIQ